MKPRLLSINCRLKNLTGWQFFIGKRIEFLWLTRVTFLYDFFELLYLWQFSLWANINENRKIIWVAYRLGSSAHCTIYRTFKRYWSWGCSFRHILLRRAWVYDPVTLNSLLFKGSRIEKLLNFENFAPRGLEFWK